MLGCARFLAALIDRAGWKDAHVENDCEVSALTVCTDKEWKLPCMPVMGISSFGHVFLAQVVLMNRDEQSSLRMLVV